MKKIYLLVIFLMCVCLSSCSPAKKLTTFEVKGTPGTEISDAEYEYLGTIDADGKASISLGRDKHHVFLLAKQPGADMYVPFALDYVNKNKGGDAYAVSSILMLSFGGAATLTGAITLGVMTGVGGMSLTAPLVMLLGGAAAMGSSVPLAYQMEFPDIVNSYKYLPQQVSNDDLFVEDPSVL